ncbi:hypothetical protein TWF694_004228 [Orbilia ellipsospora]|uniref:Uncharacterized protein n=1 Tax=Orbilia ellipsospora TaxID=2528407 RepID=A0AAV9WXG7_9PEZI
MPDTTTVLPFPSGSCDSRSADGNSSLATLAPPISLLSSAYPLPTSINQVSLLTPDSHSPPPGDFSEEEILSEEEEYEQYDEEYHHIPDNCSGSKHHGSNSNHLQILSCRAVPNPSNSNSPSSVTALSPLPSSSSSKSTPRTGSFPVSPISSPVKDNFEFPEPSQTVAIPPAALLPLNGPVIRSASSNKLAPASSSYYSSLAQRQIKNLSNAQLPPCFTTIEGPVSNNSSPFSNSSSNNHSGNGHSSNRGSISISSNPLFSFANLARAVSGSSSSSNSQSNTSGNGNTNGSTTPSASSQTVARKRTLSNRRKSDGSVLKSSSHDNLETLNNRYPPGLTLAEVLETTGNHTQIAVDPTATFKPNMHQSSSRLLRMTQDDRPFTRDFKDLFSTLMVSLPLTPHRLRFKTYSFTFTSDQAVNNLGSLKFSQSNRMPDPKDPSRIVTTTTTTTFSMAKEMARTVCQKFVAARFMEAVGEKSTTPFTSKNILWQLTPKGIHVLERFCQRNGINSPHIMALLSSPLNTMRLVILERDPVTDKVSQDKSTTEIIFRRFAGTTPNIKPTVTASDSDSVSEYGDGVTGIKLAETRKIYDKIVKYSFTGKSAVDWLLDCCTTIEPVETHEIAGLFARFGLVQCVVDDKIFLQQEPKKEFQPTKSAIYIVTERGKRVAGWIDAERGSLENGKAKNGHANGAHKVSRRDAGENRETNTTRLSCILADPALRLLFREFLRETLCEENLSFWLEVNDFQLQFSALNQKTLENIRESLAHAYGIYNAFLAPGSPCELNIDHTLRQDLAARMTRAVAKSEQEMLHNLKEVAGLFERAQEQVFKLMASDSVPKFARTPRYIEMSGDHGSDDGSASGSPPPQQRQMK